MEAQEPEETKGEQKAPVEERNEETKGKELEAAGESGRASRTEEIGAPDAADATVQA